MLCSLVELHIFPCKIYLTNMGLLRHLVKPEPTALSLIHILGYCA